MSKFMITLLALVAGMLPSTGHSEPLLFDNFDTGYPSWTAAGNVDAEDLHVLVADSVRMRNSGSTITRGVSTAGYDRIVVSAFLAGRLLEGADECIFEVSTDGGSNWSALLQISDGDDDGEFRWVEHTDPTYADNPSVVLRYRNASNALSDHCYAEDVAVSGFAIGSPSCNQPAGNTTYSGYVADYDPLTGGGAAARAELTSATLNSGSSPSSPVNSSSYGVPVDAAPSLHQFEGVLELLGEATSGSYAEIKDDFSYTGNGDDPRKHLPEFDFAFVQSGSHLIPAARGIVLSAHPYWEYILEPGRAWSEVGDAGMSRGAIPFSLQQRNSNCIHNGLLTFLFDATQVSKVAYQISSETCAYFQFDMWGLLDAAYTPGAVSVALDLKHAHQEQRAGRMVQKPISSLAVDHPGVDPAEFAHPSEVAANDLTIYGVVFDSVHYVGGCATRDGTHPYCGALRVPSYSTAKTAFAAAASMRLERRYPGYLAETIATWVPEAAVDSEGDWNDVTIEDALDMATGNYLLSGYIADEGSISTNDFFLPDTHAEKVDYSVSRYPRKATPGTEMHYHTTDTYLAAAAGQRYLREQEDWCADLFDDVIVDEMWSPLGFDFGTLSSRRTYDAVKQPFGGFGLSYVRDDVAKLGVFLGVDHGRIDGTQTLAPEELAEGKFSDPAEPGLPWSALGDYNNAFWGRDKSADTGCATMVPYLSGFGGITVALTPGGVVYYYFSDGDSFTWDRAFVEAENLRGSCNVAPPAPPANLEAVAVGPDEVVLRWDPSANPVGVIRYRIYRDGILIATTSGNDMTDAGVAMGQMAEYLVESIDVTGTVSTTSETLTVGETTVQPVPGLGPLSATVLAAMMILLSRARRLPRA
ncbi:MAG: CubicO group peptidase (beta-lactamase class C family) [Myxococcota bacterium]